MSQVLNSDVVEWMTSVSAAQWYAAGTWATAVVALVAATVGLRQVGKARRLREDQAQPYVVALMEQNATSPDIIEVAFRNYGTTAARNIKVTSDPKLRCTGSADGNGGVHDVWIPELIPILAPGQEWRTFWDDGPERLRCAELQGEDAHRIDITFDGVKGTGQQSTTSVLDWAANRGRLFVNTKTLHDAATALYDVSKTIKGWSEGQVGLAVFTRDGEAKDEQAAERTAERRRAFEVRREERDAALRQLEAEPQPEAEP